MAFDIDEATDFCKHKASNYKRMSVDAGTMDLKPEEARFEEECKRYEQLAEWLTELKARREADRWIPVSERLPDTDNFVLVYDGSEMFVAWYSNNSMTEGWYSFDGNYDDSTPITAWKPLPEPYKENDK